jgi:hypothetical protein
VRRVAILALLLAAPVHAGVTLDSQTRNAGFSSLRTHQQLFCSSPQSCSVFSTTQTPDSGSAAAMNFAPFSANLTSAIFPSVSVTQQSTITPSHLEAHASHAAQSEGSLGSGGSPGFFVQDYTSHSTHSLYRVRFTLDEPTPYALTGNLFQSGAGFIGDTDGHVELRRSTGEVLHRIAVEDDDDCFDPSCTVLGPLSLDEAGTLAAGHYVLEAEITGQTGVLLTFNFQAASGHTGSFDVDLRLGPPQVPTPSWIAPPLALALAALARASLRSRGRPRG